MLRPLVILGLFAASASAKATASEPATADPSASNPFTSFYDAIVSMLGGGGGGGGGGGAA